MKAMKRFFLWLGLLSKRLLRRGAYLAVLMLVPLFALAVALFARQDSGVLTVALCREGSRDRAAAAVEERLTAEDSVLRYLICEDEEEARAAVRSGRADAAWIFSADMQRQLDRFAERGRAAAVTVVEREDNVFLSLAREKLFAALYPETSAAIFRAFLAEELGADDLSRSELARYYHSGVISERILRFETISGEEAAGGSYMTAPLRGILALLLVLCGLASGMYCYREEREGSFVWLSARKRRYLPLMCHLTAMLPAALAALLAMALSGVALSPGREALLMLLYLPAAALFCELLRCLCPREEQYGALIPILTVGMLVLCPVFLDLDLVRPLRMCLPPYWYLRASFDGGALRGLLLYAAVLLPLTALAALLRQKRRGL